MHFFDPLMKSKGKWGKSPNIALLCMFSLLFALPTLSQMQFEQIGNTTTIPDNVVTDIAQDKDGYLWIATAAGVVRHDGYRFKLFRHKALDASSLGGNFVRNVNVFDNGSIWFSTESGGVSIYHPDTGEFTQLFDQQALLRTPALSSVSQVVEGVNNQVWLATSAGVYRVTRAGKVLNHYSTDSGLPHNSVRALLRDRRGDIYAGSRAGLAQYFAQDDTFNLVAPTVVDPRSLSVRSLFESKDGRIWVGTNSSGLWVYQPQSKQLQPTMPNQPESYKGNTVYDVFQFNNDEIWAARFGGIDRLAADSGKWLSRIIHDPSDSFSLANNDIRTMLKDDSGVIWIGGYGSGVQRVLNNVDWLKTLRFSLLRENALTEPNVSSVLALSNGLIWAGTRGGGINIVDPALGVIGGHFPEVGTQGKLQAGWITTMAEFANGDIWVGANPGQLYRFDKQSQTFFLYGQEQGLPRGNIRVLRPSGRGGLWIGSNSGLVYWDNNRDQFTSYRLQDGQPMTDGINALHEDEAGRLLVATGSAGLYQVDAGSQHLLAVEGQNENGEPLNTLSIVGMLKDSAGRLWLDSPAGLYLAEFDSSGRATLENHSKKQGFGGRPMGANLLEDQLGRIWTPTYVYDPDIPKMTPLQPADGVDIGTSWFRSYTKTADGLLLFGGSRGLLIMDPSNYSPWDYMPPVVISELRIDGKEANAGLLAKDGLTLTPKQRSFTFEFAALDMSAPEKNQYRYQLIGFDKDWVAVDATRRIASYSNLWPGEYTFNVTASNRTGQWSNQQLTFKVTVEAAYWQTYWFAAVCIVLIASIAYLGFRLRTSWIKAKARELEKLVNERTQELKKAQQDFIEQEKMASLGSLVAGVSHEINTPMGIALTAATALSDDCRSLETKVNENRLKRSELEKHLEKARSSNKIILSSLERACDLMTSFKQVAVDQTSEQRRKIVIKTLLQDIERSLHSLYAKRGHQLHINCPPDVTLDSYPGAIFQVFTNLISNSIIHGFAGTQNGSIHIDVEAKGKQLLIQYRDNGVGMTDEVKKKAFEPFFTTKLGVGGSGLGMHLVYNYVSQVLGGKIRIESSPGNGFQCKMQIPLVAPSKDS